MRRDWRKVLAIGLLFLMGVGGGAARQDGKTAGPAAAPEAVRLTIELSWVLPGDKAASDAGQGTSPGLILELSEGRVVEAIPWPPDEAGVPPGWGPAEREGWRLGVATEGRVRARIEAPVDAKLIVRGGDQVVSVPMAAVLERPQHNPSPARLTVAVERLAWDALTVDLGESAIGGIAAPGAEVPVSVGFNILWPEATDVTVRYSAVLRPARGGEVISRRDGQEVLPTNRLAAPARVLGLRAPMAEGAYTIEVQASWEPVVREGSRLGRLIRRRKPAVAATSSVRRVALTVLGPAAPPAAEGGAAVASARDGRRGETEVDSVDLVRPRIHRFLTSGRSPMAEDGRSAWDVPAQAVVEPSRRDRLRGGFLRPGPEADRLDPADGSGLSWSAVGLKAAHPERPHRLTLTIQGGEPSSLGVGLIEARDARPDGPRPRVLLDACASGPPILEDGPPLSFSWLVWPGSAETVLVVFNRSPDAAVRLGTVTLTELEDLPGPPPIHEPTATATRALGLYLDGAHPLDPFGGDSGPGDAWAAATNLARYLAYCGASAVVAPESLADRPDRRALDGQADEDTAGPDRLDVLRRVLQRQGCSLWLELSFDGHGVLPGLPPPDSDEAVRRGLVRLDGRGRAADSAYHPLHPEVRRAMRRRVVEALTRAGHGPAADARTAPGLVIRLGPGPTLLGTPDTGVDDATYAQFVRETFSPETARSVRGRGTEDPERFAVRLDYLAGAGRMPWLTWRSRAMASLYAELNAAAQEAVPGTVLAVVTPGLDGGPAGAEARRVDLAGLTPGQAWRSVGLDLASWPAGPIGPAVLRGVALSTDALAHDLATSPDLDAIVAGRPRRGLLLTIDGSPPAPRAPTPATATTAPPGSTIRLSALPLGDGPSADEPLGHALAALDAHWVFLAAGAAAGHEERLRRFAGTLRALPAWPSSAPDTSADPRTLPFGTAVRSSSDATQSFLAIANDSPYPIRLACLLEAPETAVVEDLSRGFRLSPTAEAGGRNLVLDLLPFGVSAIRIGAPGTRVASLTAYPSEAVLAGMQARSRELATQLARLNQGLSDGATEPANPGFEPAPEAGRPPSPSPAAEAGPTGEPLPPLPGAVDPGLATAGGIGKIASDRPAVPGGWRVESGDPGATQPARGGAKARAAATIAIDRDRPHTGRGSLRLSATDAPASVVSAPFSPNPQSSLTIQAYLRTEPPGSAVRIWIEGESAGRPYVRRSELAVSSAWEARAVRASDMPPGGLDSARVRFEMTTPGVLWIDDLRVGGDAASRSARLNAQRTMLAALQAYRERRYADFARLAASHWVRESAVAAARMARSGDPRPAPGARPADTEASALSPDRTLR